MVATGVTLSSSGVIQLGGTTSSYGGIYVNNTGGQLWVVDATAAAGTAKAANFEAQSGSFSSNAPAARLNSAGYADLVSGGCFDWSSSSTSAKLSVDTLLCRTAAGVVSFDTSQGNGAGVAKLTAVQLVPSAGGACNSGRIGRLYVAVDGTFCSCNGTVWTPTPLTGTCN
jgi:hypothetical protein